MADKTEFVATLPLHEARCSLELKMDQLKAITSFLVVGELYQMADGVQAGVLGLVSDLTDEVAALAAVVDRAVGGEVSHG
ncbi:MAG: hypothetical protein LCI02_09635 [Proteobacteria bacterium]|nr:hypothetical protein [Pseudomonadota bacterium]